eukprot:g6116.t1
MEKASAVLKKNIFTFYDDGNVVRRDNIPLYIMMEGRSWGLTSLLITTVALWMVAFSRGETDSIIFFEGADMLPGWTSELLEYAIFSFLGACAVFVCVGSLHLNIRPPGRKRMRTRILLSSLCLMGVNGITGYQAQWSVRRLLHEDDEWISKPAHAFIISCAVLCTVLADVLFVQYFGCCMFWSCCALPSTPIPLINPELAHDLLNVDERVVEESYDDDATVTLDAPTVPVQEWRDVVRGHEEIEVVEAESSVAIDVESSVGSTRVAYQPHSLQAWNTRRVLKRYEETSQRPRELSGPSTSEHENVATEAPTPFAQIPQDRPRPEDLSWFVSNLRTPRRWLEQVVDAVKEEETNFTYSVWVKASALTTFLVMIYICILTTHNIYRVCETWSEGLGCLGHNEQVVRDFIKDLGCMSESWRSFLFSLMDYVDTVIPRLKYTVCFGYPIGCFFALHSVYSVMVQYKRLTRAMDHEVHQLESSVVPSQKSSIVKDLWPELEKKYPIGGAVYFLGILCSTAVLQLQVFGLLISIILAVLVNYEKYGYIMRFVGFYILIYIIIFAVDWLVLHILPNRLLSTGLRIKRPHVFFVYMFVFSIVHLVLVTFLLINRLDITLSKEYRALDSGHKAFMSLLVLTNVVHRDKFHKKKRRGLRRVKTAVVRVMKNLQRASSTPSTNPSQSSTRPETIQD